MQPTSSTRSKTPRLWLLALAALLTVSLLAAFDLLILNRPPAAAPLPAGQAESTPRLAIISAFEPETRQILAQAQVEQRYQINGRTFTTAKLAGHEVVILLSGTSMVNAAMNTQAVLDHFQVSGILFSGIAGGVNPDLNIGDVVIPAEWAQYQEQVFARQMGPTSWDLGIHSNKFGNYGMMFPQPVSVTHAGGLADRDESKFWFSADPKMLAAAQKTAGQVELKKCPQVGPCLRQTPRVVVGGKGVSGPTFVDNADYRKWVWQTFQADALDMESAAVAQVAYTNHVPFLAVRSLSDLAGGGPGENEMVTFLQLAADHAASVLVAFLKNY